MKYHYVDGPPVNFEYSKYVGNPEYEMLPPVINMIIPKTSVGEGVSTPIDTVCDLYQTKFSIDSTAVFDEFKKLTSETDKAFLVYVGKNSGSKFDLENGQAYKHRHVHKHFHYPRMDDIHSGNYLSSDRRTVTAIIPISVIDPITEIVCWIPFEYDFLSTKNTQAGHDKQAQWIKENLMIDDSKTQHVKLPESGQYLILDFDSAHNLHWIENAEGSNNEYICLVLDMEYPKHLKVI